MRRLIDAKISKSDLDNVEKYADRLYKSVGIDVEFTRHFLDRGERCEKQETNYQIDFIRMFKQSYKRYGKKIATLGHRCWAVLNDMQTDEYAFRPKVGW